MLNFNLISIFFVFLLLKYHTLNGVEVEITGGRIRGYVVSNSAIKGSSANVFKGVPFAEPPIGDLRFQKLKEKSPWEGVLETMNYSSACPSNTTRTTSPQYDIDEDCIYVNIFADSRCLEEKINCSVLVYLHGGAFAYDSAVMFNETQIVKKYATDEMIFVIPAFRLGILGFFDIGSENIVPQNLGFYDIIYALEWIKHEIGNFGGDPTRITLFGNSAGASTVEYLMLTPLIREDLFQQVIISSGIPTISFENVNIAPTIKILDDFNCSIDSNTGRSLMDEEKVNCLRRISAVDLMRQQSANELIGLVFNGPQYDGIIFPEKNFKKSLAYWRPKTALITTTKFELSWMDSSLKDNCIMAMNNFGYTTKELFEACIKRYNDSFTTDHPKISWETYHASSNQIARKNTIQGGLTYRATFDLNNSNHHANDMRYFFGLHWLPLNTSAELYMDWYFPKFIKNFVKNGIPEKNCKPVNETGKNYFILDYVIENGQVLVGPHPADGIIDPEAMNFWFKEAALIEKNALKENKNEEEKEKIDENSKYNESIRFLTNFLTINTKKFTTEKFTTEKNQPEKEDHLKMKEVVWINNIHEIRQEMALREAWSIFWLTISLAITLISIMVIILIMLLSKILIHFNNNTTPNGYSYNYMPEYFLERSRILTKNNATPPKYVSEI